MRWLPRALGLAGLVLLSGASPIDGGELHCEEAVRHLADCCHAPLDSLYHCTAGRGCDDTRPDLDDPLATDVRDQSCDQLVASGACETPPMSPKPAPPCIGFLDSCDPQPAPNPPPPDLSLHDLSPVDLAAPPDLSSTDGPGGDGP